MYVKFCLYVLFNQIGKRYHLYYGAYHPVRRLLLAASTRRLRSRLRLDFVSGSHVSSRARARWVLVILALVAQIFLDYAILSVGFKWFARIGFLVASILVSGGFFAAAVGSNVTQPTDLIWILYAGVAVLAASVITLGIGLVKSRRDGAYAHRAT